MKCIFLEKLESLLNSELLEFGFTWSCEWSDVRGLCHVTISNGARSTTCSFIMNTDEELIMRMGENTGIWEVVQEHTSTVRYLWMELAPILV